MPVAGVVLRESMNEQTSSGGRRLGAWLLYVLLLVSTAAQPARLEHLFQAEVDAGGQDSAARDEALRRALQQVLVRVTGSEEVLRATPGQSLLSDPGRYVQQYRFREQAPEVEGQPRRLRLWVQFDGVALEKDLRRLGLSYWGRERPDVLVWLAVDDRGRRYLVPEGDNGPAARALRRVAAARGVPLTLPLMDLQDQRAVDFTDVWGGFLGSLRDASQRYHAQAILVGRVGRTASGGWRGRWTLLGGGSRQQWTSAAAGLEDVIAAGVGGAAGRLAASYALSTADASVYPLIVEGIGNLEDYARASRYLASLSPVDEVQVASVDGDQVRFELKLNGSDRGLRRIIGLGRTLQPLAGPDERHYRLNP